MAGHNHQLRAAREATASPCVPGACLSRQELAEAVNAWLVVNTQRRGALDEGYIGRLEQGRVRWPGRDYRAGFRAVLGAVDDSALGFRPSHRRPVRSPAPSELVTEQYRAEHIEALPVPSPDVAVTASQDAWLTVRRRLVRQRTMLAHEAVRLYDSAWHVPGTATLALPSWLPPAPVPIEAVTLEWEPEPRRPVLTGEEAELRPVLPLRTPRHAFPSYTSAMRYLSPPSLFENRLSYRLLDVSWKQSGQGQLRFGLATFFDKLDVSEALSHEFAAAAMDGAVPAWSRLPFRALLARPFDLSSWTAGTSIATLTIRRDTRDNSATFFLLARDPAKVATGGGQYGVVPAGEFQPASIAPTSMRTDLDLWHNIVREYSEELLDQPEYDGSSGHALDYESWPFYHAMQRAQASGHLRVYALGVVLDALALKPAVMTAVIVDDVVFDDLFRDLVATNAEGRLVTSFDANTSTHGLPFDEATVRHFLRQEPMGGTSGACLALAWKQRKGLLG